MRKKIVAGNWKMNCTITETQHLLEALKNNDSSQREASLIVAPTFTNLQYASTALKDTDIAVAAQNMHHQDKGAFTGEVSADMLQSIEVCTVILGHSERRAYFAEDDELLAQKVSTAIDKQMNVIFCFGESLQERKEQRHFEVVASQLQKALFQLTPDQWQHVILAYEPIWAIGTGETATPQQAQQMHAFIRQTIATHYNEDLADQVSILYGGSVKPANAKEIFAQPDVDGGLIGGASLNAESFLSIANAF